ncbi:MAG: hypothetical protein EOO38_14900 [Cytophagaceae bacterium]|nr:MAG: hypothetical protein EOO38_14900 [Cytophagaceae bacterium]
MGEVWPGIAYESQLDVERNICLRAQISLPSPYFDISLFLPSPSGVMQECGGLCVWLGEEVEFEEGMVSSTEAAHQLTEQHLPLFRRNCWLSGVPIEATAHEKAEWIRDFSREDIEAWNLKI